MPYKYKVIQAGITVFVVLLLSNCASWEGKFTETESANVTAFADHTISMLSESDFSITRGKAVYVRDLVDPNSKESQEFKAAVKEARFLLKGIVKYSIDMVTIVETNKTDSERIEAYARRLEIVKNNAEDRLALEPGHFDEILESVRKQEKFMDALQQAQPILNATARYAELILTKIDDSARVLARKIEAQIDENFKQVTVYQEALEYEKYNVLTALGNVYVSYKGDMQAFDRLRKSDAITSKKLISKTDPSEEDLKALSDHLMNRLNNLDKIWRQVEPKWNIYRASHHELDQLYDELLTRTGKARLFVLLWVRAHQKMAAGITNPAAWFNIKDAPALLYDIGKKAVF